MQGKYTEQDGEEGFLLLLTQLFNLFIFGGGGEGGGEALRSNENSMAARKLVRKPAVGQTSLLDTI